MNRFNLYATVSAAGLALCAPSMAAEISDVEYTSAKKEITTAYESDRQECDSLSGNASEICVAEVEGRKTVAMAELEARNDPTPEAHFKAQIATAEAAYAVATERCDDTTGTVNTNCLQSANSIQESAKAKANSELKSAETTTQVNPRATSSTAYNDRRATVKSSGSGIHATDTHFDFGSSDLRADGRATLDDFLDKSKDDSAAQISVIGHADRLGNETDNQQLSEQRTKVVKDYLVSQGIESGRISVEGKGDTQPTVGVNECQGERSAAVIACLQPDRRVAVSMSQVVGSN